MSARSRSRTWVPVALLALGLLAVTLVLGAPGTGHNGDLDPASTETGGTKALVLLLRASGAHVSVSDQPPPAGTDIALMLADTSSTTFSASVERWVEAGGVLVVADRYSSFAPRVASGTTPFGAAEVQVDRGACDITALVGLEALFVPGGADRYEPPLGSGSCFTDRGRAFVVDSPRGRGHVVALGSPSVFTNAALDVGDNAGLAVALLAPVPGRRVDVLFCMTPHGSPASTRSDLASLVPTGIKLGLVELVVAFGLYAWWRGRRLGRPVAEPQPVQIGGSELVAAHGNLLQQTREPDRAARLLRADLRRRLSERLGIPRDASPQVVAEITSERTPLARDRVERAVTDAPVRSEQDLLDLARDIDAIRTEVLHGSVK